MKKYKKFDKLKLKIESITDDGMGVARLEDDFVVFVIDAITGDEVIANIIKLKKTYAIAQVSSFLNISDLSVEPYDKFDKISGGCSISRMKYEHQLIEKQKIVGDAIERIAGIKIADDVEFCEIISMQSPYEYRNKAIYPCGINQNKTLDFGYFKPRTHDIIFEEYSIIENKNNSKILKLIKSWANKYKISAYEENLHTGILRSVMIRNTYNDTHMVGIIGNSNKLPFADELVELLTGSVFNIDSIIYNVNEAKGNKIITDDCHILYGKESIRDRLGDFYFDISMPAFFQVNREQTKKMYDKVVEFAGVDSSSEVWDLYCGTGTISLYLAKHCKFVRGNEYSEIAVKNAFENAKLNKIENVDFESGLAEEVIPKWLEKYQKPDVIILDPPRKGADINVLETIMKANPAKIVYVSCKPSTLARDLKILSKKYKVQKIQPIDLFPHTAHVESVVLMSKLQK